MIATASYLLFFTVIAYGQLTPEPIYTAENEGVDERDLACAGCLAVVDVIEKHMAKKSFDGVETRLTEVLEGICNQKNFPDYDFIPPRMSKTCSKLLDKVDEDKLSTYLTSHFSMKSPRRAILERAVCLKLSGFCVGNNRIEVEADKERKKAAKAKKTTHKEDKEFHTNVDELIKQHGDKVKQPRPVKTEL